jgi:hypothetical protein
MRSLALGQTGAPAPHGGPIFGVGSVRLSLRSLIDTSKDAPMLTYCLCVCSNSCDTPSASLIAIRPADPSPAFVTMPSTGERNAGCLRLILCCPFGPTS